MKSGKLRHHIQIEDPSVAVDDYGTPVETGAVVYTLRAEVIQQTAQEYVRDRGDVTEVTVAFRVRNPGGVTTSHRVRFDGVAYDIRQVVPIENGRGLELQTVKIGGDA